MDPDVRVADDIIPDRDRAGIYLQVTIAVFIAIADPGVLQYAVLAGITGWLPWLQPL